MNIIKFILLLLPLCFVYIAFVRTKTTHVKAYQRILFLGFIAFMIVAFISPPDISKLAVHIGFQRGSYLLIYVVVIAFIFSIIAIYLKFNEMSHRIVELARQVALLEAKIDTKKTKK